MAKTSLLAVERAQTVALHEERFSESRLQKDYNLARFQSTASLKSLRNLEVMVILKQLVTPANVTKR